VQRSVSKGGSAGTEKTQRLAWRIPAAAFDVVAAVPYRPLPDCRLPWAAQRPTGEPSATPTAQTTHAPVPFDGEPGVASSRVSWMVAASPAATPKRPAEPASSCESSDRSRHRLASASASSRWRCICAMTCCCHWWCASSVTCAWAFSTANWRLAAAERSLRGVGEYERCRLRRLPRHGGV